MAMCQFPEPVSVIVKFSRGKRDDDISVNYRISKVYACSVRLLYSDDDGAKLIRLEVVGSTLAVAIFLIN